MLQREVADKLLEICQFRLIRRKQVRWNILNTAECGRYFWQHKVIQYFTNLRFKRQDKERTRKYWLFSFKPFLKSGKRWTRCLPIVAPWTLIKRNTSVQHHHLINSISSSSAAGLRTAWAHSQNQNLDLQYDNNKHKATWILKNGQYGRRFIKSGIVGGA